MSILIKGMEMPQCCGECKFMVDRWCYASEDAYFVIDKRHPDCPLVEISTPHGRLIDGEKLLEDIKDLPYGYRGMIKDVIYGQPTVIESEE